MGDGETDEGSVWEAAALAGACGSTRLVAIVDANGTRASRPTRTPIAGPLRARASPPSAGTSSRSTATTTPPSARRSRLARRAGPRLVVAHTIKGRGVSFMEGRFDSHYKSVRPHDRERVMAALAAGEGRGMRNAFAAELERAVRADERVCLVLADLGWGVFDEVERAPPAASSTPASPSRRWSASPPAWPMRARRPVAYTIAPFITSRAHDQVRVDVAAGAADVKLWASAAASPTATSGSPTTRSTTSPPCARCPT